MTITFASYCFFHRVEWSDIKHYDMQPRQAIKALNEKKREFAKGY